jgi:hypothetical protein
MQCEAPPDSVFKPHDLVEKIADGSNRKFFKGDFICRYVYMYICTHIWMYQYILPHDLIEKIANGSNRRCLGDFICIYVYLYI